MNEAVMLGNMKCHRLVVGGERPVDAFSFFSGSEEETVRSALPRFQQSGATVTIARACMLIETPAVTVLVDPAGEIDAPGGEPLRQALSGIGVSVDDVDVVVLTHAHEDRVAGATERGQSGFQPVFCHARHLISSAELAYLNECWRSDRNGRYGQIYQHSILPVELSGLLDQAGGGHVIWSGADSSIVLEDAPGHTNGHLTVRLTAGEDTALYASDIFHHPLQVFDPRIATRGDADPAVAMQTRHATAARCSEEGIILIGCHFPGRGYGRVFRENGVYRFEPAGMAA
jgi:glyoxylase-like metal-dependent hydrolase (beta-lactamase superfamily II)